MAACMRYRNCRQQYIIQMSGSFGYLLNDLVLEPFEMTA